jgi:hypothetical protein
LTSSTTIHTNWDDIVFIGVISGDISTDFKHNTTSQSESGIFYTWVGIEAIGIAWVTWFAAWTVAVARIFRSF